MVEKFNEFIGDNPDRRLQKVEVLDFCHSSITGGCILEGCPCRKPAWEKTTEQKQEYDELQAKITLEEQQAVWPKYIEWAMESVDGLSANSTPVTPVDFIAVAPDELVSEIVSEIRRLSQLSAAEIMGFKQPTTSGGQVSGPTSDIPAQPA